MLNSISIFTLNERITANDLANALESYKFTSCASSAPSSTGFTSPLNNGELVHQSNNCLLLALKIESKVIPVSTLKKEVAERIAKIEESENRNLSKKEKDAIKEDAYQSLILKAFTKEEVINGYFDLTSNMLIVGTSSASKAELVTTRLRRALGSLKITAPTTGLVSPVMKHWIEDSALPQDLSFNGYGKLEFPNFDNSTSQVTLKQENFESDYWIELVKDHDVKELGLNWQDLISFTLTDELVIKSIKFTQEFKDQVNDVHCDSKEQRLDADFYLMSQTIRELLAFLVKFTNKENLAA
jgi:recombination associated protein RdgC